MVVSSSSHFKFIDSAEDWWELIDGYHATFSAFVFLEIFQFAGELLLLTTQIAGVVRNTTTIEELDRLHGVPHRVTYSKGVWYNIKEFLGIGQARRDWFGEFEFY